MTKYILLADTFEGYVSFLYNKQGYLVEFRNASFDMSDKQMQGLLNNLWNTYTLTLLQQFINTHRQYTVLKIAYDVTYEEFAFHYGVKRDKHIAQPMWEKKTLEDRTLTLWSVEAYNRYLKKYGVFQYAPKTFLRHYTRVDWDKEQPKNMKEQ